MSTSGEHPLGSGSSSPERHLGSNTKTSKSKTAAVLLAVVLAFWTWLYTYKLDAGKFWVGLILTLAGIVLTIAFVGWPILLAIWLWAVIDTATKDKAWFHQYPNLTIS